MPSHSPHPGTDRTGPVVARRPFDATESVSRTVVETLASVPEFDATAGAVLYDAVDPDALDDLFGDGPGEAAAGRTVSFPVREYRVVVDPGSGVVVHDASQRSDDAE